MDGFSMEPMAMPVTSVMSASNRKDATVAAELAGV
jgi:hypothetical protein